MIHILVRNFGLLSFLLLLTFVAFPDISNAQTGMKDCTEPMSVPTCMGDDATKCVDNCSTGEFCCPLTSIPGCNTSFEALCDGTTCDTSDICLVPDLCKDFTNVQDCTAEQIENDCSECGTDVFCCTTETNQCNADFDMLCENSMCKSDPSNICKIPKDCKSPPASLEFCTSEQASNDCSTTNDCSPGQFCCPEAKQCMDSFKNICEGTSCASDKICVVPPAPRATRNLKFINNCGETIWVGGSGTGLSDANSGFKLDSMGGHKTITVSGSLQSANFWPRTSCTFPCSSVPCCETGDCANANNMEVECKGGTKSPPANSFEITFNEFPGNDFYDITNVDGYTVGIAVKQTNGIKLPGGTTINGNPAPELNCGNPACTDFDMGTCPPELSKTVGSKMEKTERQICWSISGAANDPGQRSSDSTGILSSIASDCSELALVGAACGAMDTGGTSCGLDTDAKTGCGESTSLFCCSPYNDQLPMSHGGIGCADANDPNYVNTCTGVWPTPDEEHKEHDMGNPWKCSDNGINEGFCTYNGIFEQQCPQAYSWQFNDSTSTYQCINSDYEITFCPTSLNTDHDQVLDNDDTDSDNDGIPDSSENSFEIMNRDSAQVVNPEDPDGDGIPNELDLDSDGDGIPDHIEGGGSNDADRNGFADNFVDLDNDGHHDEHDEDQTGNVIPLTDTDGDGIPDFLDTDSDNDGVSDTNETTGMDVDGDGILDDSEDRNRDGIADSVHPTTGLALEFIDTDGDGIFNHLDPADTSGGSCSLVGKWSGKSKFNPLWLLIPVAIIFRRIKRK